MANFKDFGTALMIHSRVREDAQQQEQDARDEHRTECDLPRKSHAQHNAVREVGVEAHAGRESYGIVGVETHDQRADSRREASRHEHGISVHTGVGEDQWVHEYDVGHGEKRRDAGKNFGPYRHAVLGKLEV